MNGKTHNPKDELQAAIENLEEFANQNKFSPVPIVLNLDVKNNQIVSCPKSRLQKKIDITRHFISGLFSTTKQDPKRLEVQKTLLHSIEFLKTHYRLIEKLKQGSDADQELASWALKAINRYNALIQKQKEKPRTLSSRAARFVYKQSGLTIDEELTNHPIIFPYFFSAQFSSLSGQQDATTEKVASLFYPLPREVNNSEPTKNEVEALHMKAVTLLRSPDFPPSLRTASKTWLKESPVIATVSKAFFTGEDADASIVSLKQTISPFPGEVITVQGSFKRDAKSHVPSVPIPNSFHVSTKAFQTGFPHSLQHTGWALADELIPSTPLRLNDLPLFQELYHKKATLAKELLPTGSLNENAKSILKLKKRIFDENCQDFLSMHERLFNGIVRSAQDPQVTTQYAEPIIRQFYEKLKSHQKPFEHLSHVHHIINELFIKAPYQALQETWIEGKLPPTSPTDPKEYYFASLNLLEKEILKVIDDLKQNTEEPAAQISSTELDYLLCIGTLIGSASKAIILQQFSETIGFPPPLLSNFEKKIQTCVFKHELAFTEEMSLDPNAPETKETLERLTRKHLKEEYNLFKMDSSEYFHDLSVKISNELEIYYNARYYRSTQKH